MQIQGYSSTQAVNPFELSTQSRRRTLQEQSSRSGDTVSISPEAMELLARMQTAKQEAAQDEANKLDTSQSTKSTKSDEANKTAATKTGGAASDSAEGTEAVEKSNGGSKDASSDTNEQAMEQIRKQIQQLSTTIQNIMKGSQPIEAKLAQSQPFEIQIHELEERLRELEASAKDQTQQQE